jgi:hypothetical protein
MLERHLSKRKRQRVAIKKKSEPRIFLETSSERIKENIFRASGQKGKKSGDHDRGSNFFREIDPEST